MSTAPLPVTAGVIPGTQVFSFCCPAAQALAEFCWSAAGAGIRCKEMNGSKQGERRQLLVQGSTVVNALLSTALSAILSACRPLTGTGDPAQGQAQSSRTFFQILVF